MKQKPNIILISIDTLRADHVSCYGYERLTTPNIDRLAGEGTRYLHAYSTAVWTPPAHASMLTGLYPAQHGVVHQNKLAESVPTIAELLQKNGYQTAGFVNNSQVGELVGLQKGHEDFYEIWRGLSRGQLASRVWHKAKEKLRYADNGAAETNAMVKNWLIHKRKTGKPFYLFVHYIDVHNPLRAPRPFAGKFFEPALQKRVDAKRIWSVADNPLICYTDDLQLNEAEQEALKAIYDEEVCYLDHRLGQLFRWLKQHDYLDDTLLILTADHGEHLGEHGQYSHVASVSEPVLHVPLILHYPGVLPENAEVEKFMQLTDILPIVLSAAGVEYPGQAIVTGRELFRHHCFEKERSFVVAEWEGRIPYFIQSRLERTKSPADLAWMRDPLLMIRDRRHKLIKGSQMLRLYDLRQDPGENLDISQQSGAIVQRLLAQLEQWQAGNSVRQKTEEYEYDAEIKKHLTALGYL
jgi:arylsulfatase A-like enzyme